MFYLGRASDFITYDIMAKRLLCFGVFDGYVILLLCGQALLLEAIFSQSQGTVRISATAVSLLQSYGCFTVRPTYTQ